MGGKRYPSGALLAANFDDYLAGKRELQLLFTPTAEQALSGYSGTRDHLILSIMDNVVNRLEVLTPQGGSWQRRPLGNLAPSAPFRRRHRRREQRLFPDRQRVPAADLAVHGQSRRR